MGNQAPHEMANEPQSGQCKIVKIFLGVISLLVAALSGVTLIATGSPFALLGTVTFGFVACFLLSLTADQRNNQVVVVNRHLRQNNPNFQQQDPIFIPQPIIVEPPVQFRDHGSHFHHQPMNPQFVPVQENRQGGETKIEIGNGATVYKPPQTFQQPIFQPPVFQNSQGEEKVQIGNGGQVFKPQQTIQQQPFITQPVIQNRTQETKVTIGNSGTVYKPPQIIQQQPFITQPVIQNRQEERKVTIGNSGTETKSSQSSGENKVVIGNQGTVNKDSGSTGEEKIQIGKKKK